MFDSKFVIAVREDLLVWQKLNVASFLAGGIAGSDPALVGEAYGDASGTRYGALVRQPIVVFAGGAEELRKAHARALERNVRLHVYIREMFATGHDAANRQAVAQVARQDLDLVGLGFIAERKVADKITKGLCLHP